MNEPEILHAPQYILEAFEPPSRIAILVLNRNLRDTVQRITTAVKAPSPEFQSWLRYKNASGADIYMGMNPLKPDAATRTKDEIDSIRHVYIDLDYGGEKEIEAVQKSSVVPKPNVILASSPDKFQIVWRIEGIDREEAEALLHALSKEFGGDPQPPTQPACCQYLDSPTRNTKTTFMSRLGDIQPRRITCVTSNFTSTDKTPQDLTIWPDKNANLQKLLSVSLSMTGPLLSARLPAVTTQKMSFKKSRTTGVATNPIRNTTRDSPSQKHSPS